MLVTQYKSTTYKKDKIKTGQQISLQTIHQTGQQTDTYIINVKNDNIIPVIFSEVSLMRNSVGVKVGITVGISTKSYQ